MRKSPRPTRQKSKPNPPSSGGYILLIIAGVVIGGILYLITRPQSPVPTTEATQTPTKSPTETPTSIPTVTPTATLTKSLDPKIFESEPNTFPEPTVTDSSCLKPSMADYIDGIYDLAWTTKGSRYEGILVMSQDRGRAAIRFFNSSTNSEDTVIQNVRLVNCTFGLTMLGSNPRRRGEKSLHPSYRADNFVLRRETNGNLIIFTTDAPDRYSSLSIQKR